MRPSLTQLQLRKCLVCLRLIYPEVVKEDLSSTALFGAINYAVCWCGQEMTGNWTPSYRRRWETYRIAQRKKSSHLERNPRNESNRKELADLQADYGIRALFEAVGWAGMIDSARGQGARLEAFDRMQQLLGKHVTHEDKLRIYGKWPWNAEK